MSERQVGAAQDHRRARRWLGLALVATLAFRFWLAAVFPFTPDEAYFSLWGRYPDLGYYDHPPMVGWWLALIGLITESVWALRLPATLLPVVSALLVRTAVRRWRRHEPALADWAAICVLLLPANVWNVLITTDTPLVFFALLSILAFAGAAGLASGASRLAAFFGAGLLLGLAFTSKYFAVPLGIAYLCWAFIARRTGGWSALAMVVLGATPFILLNLYWNSQACWCNVMFNLINRHDKAGWSATTPALYVLTLAYLLGPLLYFAWRARAGLRASLAEPRHAGLLVVWVVPFVLFALLSLYVRVGLHWLLLFLPAAVLSVAFSAGTRALAKSARILAALAGLHVLVAAVAAAMPLETWNRLGKRGASLYSSLVFLTQTRELLARVAKQAPGFEVASSAYAPAAVLSYHSGTNVPVFGMGSSHARQDDFLTDWRSYEGKNIVVVQRGEASRDDYAPYFREVELRRIALDGTQVNTVLGRGFDYVKYRSAILAPIRERFYRIPGMLPVKRCVFCERYFDSATCRS